MVFRIWHNHHLHMLNFHIVLILWLASLSTFGHLYENRERESEKRVLQASWMNCLVFNFQHEKKRNEFRTCLKRAESRTKKITLNIIGFIAVIIMVILSCGCFRTNGNRIWNKRVPYLIVWLAGWHLNWRTHSKFSRHKLFLNSFSPTFTWTHAYGYEGGGGLKNSNTNSYTQTHADTLTHFNEMGNGRLVSVYKMFSGFTTKRKVCIIARNHWHCQWNKLTA